MAGTLARVGKGHLLLYNCIQAAGWSLCLAKIIESLVLHKGDTAFIYEEAGTHAKMFQLASFLDVVHAAIGLVPSSPAMALLQWAGRSNVLFLVVDVLPKVQPSLAVGLMLLTWALSEVIRYPWYVLTTLNACPYALTWLRYTIFIPLYPVGVVSEMVALWLALPDLERLGLYSLKLPNALNWAFTYSTFVKIGLIVYLPAWWSLYSSLLRQRKKRLSPPSGTAAKVKAA